MKKLLVSSVLAPDLNPLEQEVHVELMAGHQWKKGCPAMVLVFSKEGITPSELKELLQPEGFSIRLPKDRKLSKKLHETLVEVLTGQCPTVSETQLLNGVSQRRVQTPEYRITWYC